MCLCHSVLKECMNLSTVYRNSRASFSLTPSADQVWLFWNIIVNSLWLFDVCQSCEIGLSKDSPKHTVYRLKCTPDSTMIIKMNTKTHIKILIQTLWVDQRISVRVDWWDWCYANTTSLLTICTKTKYSCHNCQHLTFWSSLWANSLPQALFGLCLIGSYWQTDTQSERYLCNCTSSCTWITHTWPKVNRELTKSLSASTEKCSKFQLKWKW